MPFHCITVPAQNQCHAAYGHCQRCTRLSAHGNNASLFVLFSLFVLQLLQPFKGLAGIDIASLFRSNIHQTLLVKRGHIC